MEIARASHFARQPIKAGAAAVRTLDALACGQLGLSWTELLRLASGFLARGITKLDDMTVSEVIRFTKWLRTHGAEALEARERMWGGK